MNKSNHFMSKAFFYWGLFYFLLVAIEALFEDQTFLSNLFITGSFSLVLFGFFVYQSKYKKIRLTDKVSLNSNKTKWFELPFQTCTALVIFERVLNFWGFEYNFDFLHSVLNLAIYLFFFLLASYFVNKDGYAKDLQQLINIYKNASPFKK